MKVLVLNLKAGYNWHKQTDVAWKKLIEEVSQSNRKFVNIKFDSLYGREEDVRKVVELHWTTLKSVECCFSHFGAKHFVEILGCITNLETLSIKHSTFDARLNLEIVELKKLKHFKLSSCDWNVLDLINSSKVESFEVDGSAHGNLQSLKQFLTKQTELESISINAFLSIASTLFDIELESMIQPFKLKTFKILNHPNDSRFTTQNEANFISFLRTHGKLLHELDLQCSLTPAMLKFVLTQFKSMKKLKLSGKNIPTNVEFYETLVPSANISELAFVEKFKDDESAKAFLGIFTRVESLSVQFVSRSVLKFIENNFHRLTNLTVKSLPYASESLKVRFPNLKEVHVDGIKCIENWFCFLKENPTIERLSLKEIYLQTITNASVQSIVSNTNLKHIKLQGGLRAMKEFFDIIREIPPTKLETLELVVNNKSETGTRPFCFILPKDESLKDLKCPYFDSYNGTT